MNEANGLTRRNVLAVIVMVFLAAAVVMQILQEYILYAKEAERLWLNDWMWISPHFLRPGGMVQLVTSFLMQFFQFRFAGAAILALVFAAVFAAGCFLQRRLGVKDCFLPAWLFPLVFMLLCNEHSYFNLRAHLALLMAMSAAVVCAFLRRRLLCALVVVAAYWIAGSAAVVLVALIVVQEFMGDKRSWAVVVASVAALFLMALLSVKMRFFSSFEEALTPLQYYEWPSTYFFPLYAWMSIPLLLLLGRLFVARIGEGKRAFAVALVLLALPLLLFVRIYGAVHNEQSYQLRQDEWNARNEDWDALIKSHEGKGTSTAFVSYLNLALAKKGQLVERMYDFNPYILQDPEAGRCAPVLLANHELSRDALKLQACVFLEWGGSAMANAQKSAFEANLLTPGESDPVELQRLVLTNRLFETEKTAGKYQRRLDRTTFYKNARIDVKYTELPDSDSFYMKTQTGRMLRQIAMQTPENNIATQFYEAYLMQSQDTTAYKHWKEFINR